MKVINVPAHGTSVTTRIKYLAGTFNRHDQILVQVTLLKTHHPGLPTQDPTQANEPRERSGGRVFTQQLDQDGNFRVGGLFSVEQLQLVLQH